ncbi:MAG: hypothetical protein QNJ51_28120 [Calothrix sp. MO_167.B12]|nr:hypothetical protein [Calothrix sp. MO_167.B12]
MPASLQQGASRSLSPTREQDAPTPSTYVKLVLILLDENLLSKKLKKPFLHSFIGLKSLV